MGGLYMPRTVNSEWGVSENPSPETVIQRFSLKALVTSARGGVLRKDFSGGVSLDLGLLPARC